LALAITLFSERGWPIANESFSRHLPDKKLRENARSAKPGRRAYVSCEGAPRFLGDVLEKDSVDRGGGIREDTLVTFH